MWWILDTNRMGGLRRLLFDGFVEFGNRRIYGYFSLNNTGFPHSPPNPHDGCGV